jgi:putative flippase GtrA
MWQKYYQLFWAQRKQLLRYFITGVSAVVLDIITLYIFKEYWHLKPVVAVIINQILMLNYVFFINKYWSFEEKNRTSKKQVTRFFILASFNYIFSVFCMWGLNEKLAFNYLLVRMFSIALMTAWNFLIYKFWVYRVD